MTARPSPAEPTAPAVQPAPPPATLEEVLAEVQALRLELRPLITAVAVLLSLPKVAKQLRNAGVPPLT